MITSMGSVVFAIARLPGQEREQVAQVVAGEPQPPSLAGVPQQRLHHRKRHHLRVGDDWSDAHLGAPRNRVRIVLQPVIGMDIQCRCKGVQISVHDEPPGSALGRER